MFVRISPRSRSRKTRLPVEGQRMRSRAPSRLGPDVEQRQRLAVQPVGRPVGRLVGAVAPDRAELLAAGGLPDLLARQDARPGSSGRRRPG